MQCPELERLEIENINLRTRNSLLCSRPDVPQQERDEMSREEEKMIMDIKEHQACGHDGEPCPGKPED
jgi:hypothetical protein